MLNGGAGIDAAQDVPMLRRRAEEERRQAGCAANARVRVVRAEMAGHYDAAATLLEADCGRCGQAGRLMRIVAWARRRLRAKKHVHDPLHRQ